MAFSNVYWAKKIATAVKGGVLGNKCVACFTTEPVSFDQIKSTGDITRTGAVMSPQSLRDGRNNEAVICINPGGEERWDSLANAHTEPGNPFVVLNNAYRWVEVTTRKCYDINPRTTLLDFSNTSFNILAPRMTLETRGDTKKHTIWSESPRDGFFVSFVSLMKKLLFENCVRASDGSLLTNLHCLTKWKTAGPWEAYIEKPDGSVELLESYKEKPPLNKVATYVREESFKRYAINNDRYAKGFGGRL